MKRDKARKTKGEERKGKGEPKLNWLDVLNELRTNPTVSIPVAGYALADLGKNASYENKNKLGVPIIETDGRYRVPSVFVLRRLGLENEDPQAA